jgi:hypothetical protein
METKLNDTSLDTAKRQAIELARLHSVVIVYETKEGAFVVTMQGKSEPLPKDARVVCISQRWDADTIQVRWKGGFSEFVTLLDELDHA